MESIDRLTNEIIKEFGDRKKEGRLDLVYDVSSKKFYPVPKYTEHKDFMPTLQVDGELLIPVQLIMYKKNGKRVLTHLLVGASSYESEKGVFHKQAHLKEAYERTFNLLNEDFDIDLERAQIFKKFFKP